MIDFNDEATINELREAGWMKMPEGHALIDTETLRRLVLQIIHKDELATLNVGVMRKEDKT